MRDLEVQRLELDEAWSYVGKKQRQLKADDSTDMGDQYVFLGMADSAKAIVSYSVGKRTAENTREFIADLRVRVLGAPEISSDGFNAYPEAVELAFGRDCTFGTVEKHYSVSGSP